MASILATRYLLKQLGSKAIYLVLLFASFTLSATAQSNEYAITNQCILQLKPNTTIEDFLQNTSDIVLKETLSGSMKIFLLEKKIGHFSTEELAAIAQSKQVIAAQYNHDVTRRSFIPNDPYFTQQWNMLNTGQLNGKPGTDINATKAWEINTSPLTKTGDTLVVAVFDEYFDLTQQDLNFFVNRNEIPNNGIDDDGNGFIDDYNGWNAYNNTGDVVGSGGSNHSTGISGVIGAYTNNTIGVSGVVSGVKILPVGASSTQESVVIKGYDYVIEMRKLWNQTNGIKGAFVVAGNSSFGVDKGNPINFPIWCALYDTMGKLGILNAAATTNQALDVDAQGDIPTTCPSKWLISVNGFSASEYRYGGYGLNNIDVAAPATSIISTFVGNNYGSQSGTSLACPHVAGTIAAMYAEACPAFINQYLAAPDSLSLYIKDWMLNAVTQSAPFRNKSTSDGRLNLYQAILNTHNFDCNNCNAAPSTQIIPIRCKGENNGAINIALQNSNSFSVEWSDGDTARYRTDLKPGLYRISITDANNCTSESVVIMQEPDTLFISNVSIVPPINGTGNIVVTANGGGDSLRYSLDGSTWQLLNIFTILQVGNYVVYVQNESGCIVSQNVVVNHVENTPNAYIVNMAPNPTNQLLQLTYWATQPQQEQWTIVDVAGKQILQLNTTVAAGLNTIPIATETLANGLYFLKSSSAGLLSKFMVLH